MPSVTIHIDNRLRLDKSQLGDDVLTELREEFKHSNPEFHKRSAMGFSTWNTPREIKSYEESGDERTGQWIDFPRGGIKRLKTVLDKFGYDRVYEDKRSTGTLLLVDLPDHNVKLWEHQETLVATGIEQENCILKAPTGSGKTTLAFAIASRINLATLVIVSTRALFDQWVTRAQKELGLRKNEIGQIRGGTRTLRPFTVAIQKTLAVQGVDEELKAYFGCIICDEVQLFAAKTFIESVDPFPAKYRIGISADHRRKDKKEFLEHDLFGEVAGEIARKDLIKTGIIVDTLIRVVPTDFKAAWYGKPDEDEESKAFEEEMLVDDRKSTFGPDEPHESKEMNTQRLLQEMTTDDDRNSLILWCVRDGLRLDSQVITMSHRRDHCRLLDQTFIRHGLTTGFLIGGPDFKREFDETRKRFEKGELQVAVGTFQAIGYGIDLPKAAVVVCTTPIAANKQFTNQVRGRVCRGNVRGKTDSTLYYLWDSAVFGDEHLRNLVRWNGRVVVWQDGKWIEAKEYLRVRRVKAKEGSGR